jgi:NADPH:quinone reductase-like Zn-dependent oxidoreductase
VPQDHLAAKPANLGFEQAAAVPISGFAALQAVRDEGAVQPGQKVLVIGAAGGVGSFAVQLAKAFGAHVTDGTRRWDLILDTAGHQSLSRLRRALTPQGTLMIVGAPRPDLRAGRGPQAIRQMVHGHSGGGKVVITI